jgi:energy-coupling factor transport system permease protein
MGGQAFQMYVEGDSLVHRLDPRVKLIWILIVMLISVISTEPVIVAMALVTVIVLGWLADIPAKRLLGAGLVLLPIMAMAVVGFPLLYHEGETILRVNSWLYVTDEGLILGIVTLLRVIALPMAAIILLMTTKLSMITRAVERLKVPYHLAFAFTIGMMYLPTLYGVALSVRDAQRARALDTDVGNLVRRARNLTSILPPVIASTINFMTVLPLSIESRGFGAYPKRTSLVEMQMRRPDYILLSVLAVLLLFTIVATIVFDLRSPML